MPSVDAVPLVDLTLYDRSAADLVARASAALTASLPGIVLRPGRTEVAMLEAEALVATERIFAIDRLPMAVAIIQARLIGITQGEGVAPTASVTFTLADALGHTIPAGTRVRLDTGTDSVIFTTDIPLVIPPAVTTGTVTVTATAVGTPANGALVGTALVLLDALFSVSTVQLAISPSGGADPENVAAWITRAGQRFARLTSVLVLPAHFVSAALDDVRVARAFVIDKYDPGAPGIPAGPNLGHVTLAVSSPGGVALSAAVKASILANLSLMTRADLTLHVVDPTLNVVPVTVTVTALATYTAAQVIANVTAYLTSYLSADTWTWGSTVWRNEVLAHVDTVAGVDRVVSLTLPGADVALVGVAPLAVVGAVSVTVQ